MKKSIFLFATLFVMLQANATIIYVDDSATGANNGTSWTNAYASLGTAIGAATATDTIVVAAGIYTPHASDRSVSFEIKQDVVMLGGFAGNETVFDATALALRDFTANASILSGDLNGNDVFPNNMEENSYHVLHASALNNITASSVIDGFTVIGGNANGAAPDFYGGGIFIDGNNKFGTVHPTFNNIIVTNNRGALGGGMSLNGYEGTSLSVALNPSFNYCKFIDNLADSATLSGLAALSEGGAIYMYSSRNSTSSPVFNHVEFINNTATVNGVSSSEYGGAASIWALNNGSLTPTFSNTFFCNNDATYGATFYVRSGQSGGSPSVGSVQVSFDNTTIVASSAISPIYNNFQNTSGTLNMTIVNSIIYTNSAFEVYNLGNFTQPTISYSLIGESGGSGAGWSTNYGVDGGNNLDTDPMLLSAAGCDSTLHILSPAIGVGNPTYGNNIGYYQGAGRQPLEISSIADTSLCSGDTWGNFNFTIADEDVPNVTVNAVSSNLSFVDNSFLQLSGSGVNRTLTIQNATGAGSTDITVYAINSMGDSVGTVFNFTIVDVTIDSLSFLLQNQNDTLYCVTVETAYGSFGLDRTWHDTDTLFNYNMFCGIHSGAQMFFAQIGQCVDSMEIILDVIQPNIALTIAPIPDDTLCTGSLYSTILNVTNESLSNITLNGVWPGNDSAYIQIQNGTDLVLYISLSNDPNWHQGSVYLVDDRGDNAIVNYNIYGISTIQIDGVYGDGFGCYYLSYTGIANGTTDYSLDGGATWIGSTFPECSLSQLVNYEVQQRVIYGQDTCYSNIYPFSINSNGTVGIHSVERKYVEIYPNPSAGIFTISGLNDVKSVEVINLLGESIRKFATITDNYTLDLSDYTSGVYFVKVSDNNNVSTSYKIIKE